MNLASPAELELLILKVLWVESPMTAKQIREQLAKRSRLLAYTSVITTVQRMVDKELLTQLSALEGKALRFEPRVAEEEISKRMIGDLVERMFDGSAEALMLRLFDVKELDADEVGRLRKLFNKKLRESKS
jgi:BlaI family penicillinase repressor